MPFVESAESLRAKTHTSDLKPSLIIGLLALVGVVLVLFGGNVFSLASGATFELDSQEQQSDSTRKATSSQQGNSSASEESNYSQPQVLETGGNAVYVFVSGAVVNPGVYTLKESMRVGDAIEAAGGFADGASSDYNNLAREIVDGEQIHVPYLSDLENSNTAAGSGSFPPSAEGATQPAVKGLININTATVTELETLPGIGSATAAKIISNREAQGPFNSPDEIMRVSGIGEKKYEALVDLICV